MKKAILILLFVMRPALALCQEVTIEWAPTDRATSYVVYRGPTPTALVKIADTSEPFYKYQHATSDILCFGVSSKNKFGESGIANTTDEGEPICLGKPQTPTGLSFTVQ